MLTTKHAAFIGIDAYGSGIAPLKSAVADARAVAASLERDHGYSSPHLLLDGEATGAAILRLLEETLPAAVKAESSVVFYYAGHGVAFGDGHEGPEGFLLPQDARRGDDSTWLSMQRVRKALSGLACKHLLVVLDCCFAGSFRWVSSRSFVPTGRPLYDSQYARFLAGTAWQALTSASHQESAEDGAPPGSRNSRDGEATNGHSPFAAALLRGLAGEADSSRGRHEPDGVITATELHQYIFEELVAPQTRSRQTPGIWPLKPENTGEFLFLVPGQERKTRPDPPLDDANNPWLGLQAYGRKDAPLFFGRERVVEQVLGRILDPKGAPLLAVVGASGTGKSSVVRAGVLPRLEKPPEVLAGRIGAWTVARLPRLQGDPRPQLEEALGKLADASAGWRKLVFIDQFEELYTQCQDGEVRDGFLRRLRELVEAAEPIHVAITLRSDFEPRLAASAELGALLAACRYLVPAMTSEEYRDVIEEPAKAKALYFEPEELVGELVDEVTAMPGGLPLLSFALSEMYRQARLRRRKTGAPDRALTREDYKAAGGVVGALHRRANELYETADPAMRETVRRLFLRMVSQEGGRLARRRVEERELGYADPAEQARVQQVLGDYVTARLLVADGGYVEPAHDTLVLAWEKLLDWLTESGSQELVRQLWGAASAWDAAHRAGSEKKASGLLWNQDPRLPLVQDLYLGASARAGELNGLERRFAERSVDRKRSRRNVVAGITAAVILALSGATWYSLDRANAEKKASATAEARRLEAETRQKEAEDANAAANASAIAERLAKEDAEKKRAQAEASAVAERLARQKEQDIARVAVAGQWLERDPTRAAVVLLEVGRPGDTAYAIHRLRGALERPLSKAVLRGHLAPVMSAAFSPDSRLIVTASADGTARVWAADGSGEPVVLSGHEGPVRSAVFSPDGRRVVTASDDETARVWAADGSGKTVILRGHEDAVVSATFSPDGRRVVTASRDYTARVWAADGSGEPVVFSDHDQPLVSAAFSPDGKHILTSSGDATAQVWAADGSGEPLVLSGHDPDEAMNGAVFSPDGKRILTSSGDATARVWAADGSGKTVVLHGHEGPVASAAFSPDGQRVVTASDDQTARVWAADGSGEPVILRGHEGPVTSVAFSPDGQRVVTASEDKTARVWAADGSGEPMILRGHEGAAGMSSIFAEWRAAFSPDGQRVITVADDMTARVWAADSSDEPVVLSGHTSTVRRAAFSSNGSHIITVSAPRDETVRVWAADGTGKPVVLRGQGYIESAAFSPDGRRVVIVSSDGAARIWAASGSGKPITLGGHEDLVKSAAFSPDGGRVVTASLNGTARIWAADGSGEPVVLDHQARVWCVTFSPDGRHVVTGSDDGMARVWTADGFGEPVVLRGHEGTVESVAFSSDGRRVLTVANDKTARVWAVDGSGEPVILSGHPIESAAFSPDGRRVVTAASDNTARVWAADGSGEFVVLSGHDGPVAGAAFSPDGRRVVTASWDNTARVWAADGSGEPVVLRGHQGLVRSVAFSPDGRWIVTGSDDTTARVWAADGTLLQASTRAATTACLEPQFRISYLGEAREEATATYDRCRSCVDSWRRKFDSHSIRSASDDRAWNAWQQCMGR